MRTGPDQLLYVHAMWTCVSVSTLIIAFDSRLEKYNTDDRLLLHCPLECWSTPVSALTRNLLQLSLVPSVLSIMPHLTTAAPDRESRGRTQFSRSIPYDRSGSGCSSI